MRLTSVLGIRKIYPFKQSDSWFRKDQWLRFSFLFRGRTARCFRLARVQVMKALMHVKSVRETRRRDIYSMWDSRIDRACKDHGLPSSKILYTGLAQSNIALSKNMLHTLALYEPRTFESLVDIAKQYHLDVGCDLFHASPPSGPFVSHDVVEDDPGVVNLIRSLWNQMRFGWNVSLTPRFLPGLPVHFLGKKYFDFPNSEIKHNIDGEMGAFLADFQSRLWFTYRNSFPPIPVITTQPIISSLDSPTSVLLRTTAALRLHLRSSVLDSPSSPSIALKIPLSTRVSDCGWGCMLRSVQMLVAQALLVHFLGRDWIYQPHKHVAAQEPKSRLHRRIIRWFADAPSSPLSIHRLVQASGSPPGTRFGPAAVCQALLAAMACAEEVALKEFEVYIAHDRVICKEEVLTLFEETSPDLPEHCAQNSISQNTQDQRSEMNSSAGHIPNSSVSPLGDLSASHILNALTAASSSMNVENGKKKSERRLGLLILLPMRLGAGDRIEAGHLPTLLRLLQDPACVGLIGGRPRHSVYVAGVQSDRLIHLDPHFCQEAVDVSTLSDDDEFDLSTWHCSTPRVMRAQRLDPSLALGFYCGSRNDAVSLLHRFPIISESEISSSSTASSHHLIEVVTASQVQHLFAPPQFSDPHPPSDDAGWDGVHDGGDTCLVDL